MQDIKIDHFNVTSSHQLLKNLKKEKLYLDHSESRMLLIYEGFIKQPLKISIIKKDEKIIAVIIVDQNILLNTLLNTRCDINYQGYMSMFVKKNHRKKGYAHLLLKEHMEFFYSQEKNHCFSARDDALHILLKNKINTSTIDNMTHNFEDLKNDFQINFKISSTFL